jgi:hypothetical protein
VYVQMTNVRTDYSVIAIDASGSAVLATRAACKTSNAEDTDYGHGSSSGGMRNILLRGARIHALTCNSEHRHKEIAVREGREEAEQLGVGPTSGTDGR